MFCRLHFVGRFGLRAFACAVPVVCVGPVVIAFCLCGLGVAVSVVGAVVWFFEFCSLRGLLVVVVIVVIECLVFDLY